MSTDPGLAEGASRDLDAMVIRVIDRASIPGRVPEPQRATQLAAVEQVDVAYRTAESPRGGLGQGRRSCLCTAGVTARACGIRSWQS